MQVSLLDHSHDPIVTLYEAFKVCYSPLTPQEIHDKLPSRATMEKFIKEKMATGHVSPFEQVWFEFAISGVSRACGLQLVRHHIGTALTQQSQRYVSFANKDFDFVVPPSIRANEEAATLFEQEMWWAGTRYNLLIELGIPEEDARYLFPEACATNFKWTCDLAELIHICDERLCTQAQWEIRKLFTLIRKEVKAKFPILGAMLGPKCLAHRKGYCDEPLKCYESCPLAKVRPHKSTLDFGDFEYDDSEAATS